MQKYRKIELVYIDTKKMNIQLWNLTLHIYSVSNTSLFLLWKRSGRLQDHNFREEYFLLVIIFITCSFFLLTGHHDVSPIALLSFYHLHYINFKK